MGMNASSTKIKDVRLAALEEVDGPPAPGTPPGNSSMYDHFTVNGQWRKKNAGLTAPSQHQQQQQADTGIVSAAASASDITAELSLYEFGRAPEPKGKIWRKDEAYALCGSYPDGCAHPKSDGTLRAKDGGSRIMRYKCKDCKFLLHAQFCSPSCKDDYEPEDELVCYYCHTNSPRPVFN